MSTRFIPGGTAEPQPPMLEAQQSLLIGALRRAGRRPVSYAELREAGVELPASVISELELAGIRIERCYGGAHGERRVVGVRLAEPIREPEPEQPTEPPALEPAAAGDGWNPIRVYRASPAAGLAHGTGAIAAAVGRRGRSLNVPGPRLVVPVALGLALVGLAVLVATGLGGGASRTHATTAHRSTPKAPLATAPAHVVNTPAKPSTTAATPPTPVSPALATQLEAQGHSLMESGQYATAVPVLRRAVAATGQQQNACLEPASSDCLTYAYALYDLGRALRLSGHSSAAVPVLEARLQIDNQRPVVAAELQLARQQTG